MSRHRLSAIAAILLLAGCASAPAPTPAVSTNATTSADEQAVRAVVDRLFDGMRTRDTALMASVFHDEARFYGVGRDGTVQVTLPASFIAGIGRAPAGMVLDEVLQDVEVRIDGPLASAWMYYDFFAGDDFSHCGYDAMQLLKAGGEWKIVALADSRRTEGCRRQRG